MSLVETRHPSLKICNFKCGAESKTAPVKFLSAVLVSKRKREVECNRLHHLLQQYILGLVNLSQVGEGDFSFSLLVLSSLTSSDYFKKSLCYFYGRISLRSSLFASMSKPLRKLFSCLMISCYKTPA